MEKRQAGFVPVQTEPQRNELAALASEIWHECFAELLSLSQIDFMVDKFQSRTAMQSQMDEEGYEYYFATQDGEVQGYVGVQPKDGKLYLSKLYLRAAARGTGLAPAALAFVEDLARQRGCSHVWLTVNRQNARAIAAYKKAGFGQIREQVVDIGGGFVMDDYVLEKAV